jgi:hypothetical protein
VVRNAAENDLVGASWTTGRPTPRHTAISFFAAPSEFITMAQDAGLEFVRYWQHDHPNTRNNYLFRKAS